MSHGSNPYDPSQSGQPYGSGPAQPYGSGPVQPPVAPQPGGPGGSGGQPPYGAPQQGQAPYGQPQNAPYGAPEGSPYGAPGTYGAPGAQGAPGFAPTSTTVLPGGPQAVGPDGEPVLSQPLYGATFMQALKRYFKKYARFSGYASLSEFWWAQLGIGLIGLVLSIPLMIGYFAMIASAVSASATYESGMSTGATAGMGVGGVFLILGAILSGLFSLAIIVPSLAITSRRLHDAGFSAWFMLLYLVPSVGSLIVLVLTILPTKPEARRGEWDDHNGD